MERQTRQLLGLLAEDLTDDIITQLAGGELPERELRIRVGSSRQTLNRFLERLEDWGVVAYEKRTQTSPGPPARIWRLLDPDVLTFSNQADAFALEVMDRRAERQRAGMKQRTKRRMKGPGRSAGGGRAA